MIFASIKLPKINRSRRLRPAPVYCRSRNIRATRQTGRTSAYRFYGEKRRTPSAAAAAPPLCLPAKRKFRRFFRIPPRQAPRRKGRDRIYSDLLRKAFRKPTRNSGQSPARNAACPDAGPRPFLPSSKPCPFHFAKSDHFFGFIVGKRMTSRMVEPSVRSMTSRSTPIPSPPVGGRPYSSAFMKSSSTCASVLPARALRLHLPHEALLLIDGGR